MTLRERTRHWPRQRFSELVAAASYGTVLVLGALLAVDVDRVDSGLGWELVAGVGVATWLAHLYAELVAAHIRGGGPLERHQVAEAMVDGLPIVAAAIVPGALLLLGRLGTLDSGGALLAADVVAVAQLVAVGVLVASATPAHEGRRWTFAALSAAVGIGVAAIKFLLHH